MILALGILNSVLHTVTDFWCRPDSDVGFCTLKVGENETVVQG